MSKPKITSTPAKDLERALPKSVRPFVRLTCDIEPHEGFPELCRAIGDAFRRFERIPCRWREIGLCVSNGRMITMFTPAAAICVAPRVGIMGVALENTVCLLADLLLLKRYEKQVLAVAEELTHVLLNVRDENLAAWIVAFLCSDLAAYRDGEYVSPEGFSLPWPPGKKDWEEVYSNKEFDFESDKPKLRGCLDSPKNLSDERPQARLRNQTA